MIQIVLLSALLGLILTADQISEYQLTSESRVIQACDYKKEITSLPLSSTLLPCSTLYTPALTKAEFTTAVNITVMADVDKLTSLVGKQCFKLKLITSCKYFFWSANEISKRFEVGQFSADECLSGSACDNCEIAGAYPVEDCSTFSTSVRSTTVLFRKTVVVYSNQLNQYFYGSLQATIPYFTLLNAQYGDRIHFIPTITTAPTTIIAFYINPTNNQLISLDDKILISSTGKIELIYGQAWCVYTMGYYALASQLPPMKTASTSTQVFSDFFFQAQMNITEWHIQYLDCRMKNLIMSSANISDLAKYDLGPGEIVDNGMVRKFACSSISAGKIVATSKCLSYAGPDNIVIGNLNSFSEVIPLNASCATQVRLNSTHVLNFDSAGSMSIVEFGGISLVGDEEVLRYPPQITKDLSEIRRLIATSAGVNFGSRVTTVIEENKTPNNVITIMAAPIQNTSWVWWIVIIIGIIIVAIAGFFAFRWYIQYKAINYMEKEAPKERELGQEKLAERPSLTERPPRESRGIYA